MGDVQCGEIALDHLHHHGNGLGARDRQPLVLGHLVQRSAVLSHERLPHRHQIVAGIQAFRNIADGFAERLAVAQMRGAREYVDLRTGVVDVVFAGDVITGAIEQTRQRIAKHGAAAMANMHRSRRIGRHVFDIDLLTGSDRAPAIRGTVAQHRAQRIGPGRRLQREIDEAGSGDIHRRHQIVFAQLRSDSVSQIARLGFRLFRQHHRGIARHVAMRRILGRLDDDARQIDAGGQHAFTDEGVADRVNAREHVGEQMRGRNSRGHGDTGTSLRRRIPAGLHQDGIAVFGGVPPIL